MKLTGKTDIDAPISEVYRRLNDHPAWEAEARARGIEVERPVDVPLTGIGTAWRALVPHRGRLRKLTLRLDAMTPDKRLDFAIDGQSLSGLLQVELSALSPKRTRLRLTIDVKPKTLAARLFLNTLRLTKSRVEARLDQRLGQLGARMLARPLSA